MRKIFKNQLEYLFVGVVIWLPIAILYGVAKWLYEAIENTGETILNLFLPSEIIYSGSGLIMVLLILYCSGLVLERTFVRNFFAKIPILGLFFGQKEGKIITLNRLLKLTPCLFLYTPTCPSYCWVVSEKEEKVHINGKETECAFINIYYPNVPTIITGQIFPVRKEMVIKLGNPSKEIIDLLLYALRSPENLRCLPWPNETRENLEKRVKAFGLNLSNISTE